MILKILKDVYKTSDLINFRKFPIVALRILSLT